MRILFDTNVILDLLLGREPYVDVSEQLLSLVDMKRIDGVLCATTITTIDHLASKANGPKAARQHVRELLVLFDVAEVGRDVLAAALDLGFDDYEDAVLHEAAVAAGAVAIVTRNGRDLAKATLPVFEPAELLAVTLAAE